MNESIRSEKINSVPLFRKKNSQSCVRVMKETYFCTFYTNYIYLYIYMLIFVSNLLFNLITLIFLVKTDKQ